MLIVSSCSGISVYDYFSAGGITEVSVHSEKVMKCRLLNSFFKQRVVGSVAIFKRLQVKLYNYCNNAILMIRIIRIDIYNQKLLLTNI